MMPRVDPSVLSGVWSQRRRAGSARCSRRSALCLAYFSVLLAAAPCPAFVLQSNDVDGHPRHPLWLPQSRPIPFVVNDRSFALFPDRSGARLPLPAIEAALRAWSIPPVELYLDGIVTGADFGGDDMNLISVAHTPEAREAVEGSAATTTIWWNQVGGQAYISEADIVLNPEYQFATDGAPDARDIQARVTHQLAWALGLDDSPIAAASTFGYNYAGQTHQQTLERDDTAGLRFLYGGDPDPRCGAIAGHVLTVEGDPLFGAHIVATDAAGVAQVGALTGWDGDFVLPDLPAGTYTVYAEPLDGPIVPASLDYAYRDARRDFRTLFVGGNDAPAMIVVEAGETTLLNPLRVEPLPPRLNPDWITWSPDGEGFRDGVAQVLQIAPGKEAFLVVGGLGLTAVPPSGFSLSGGDISIDTSRVARGNSNRNNPYAILPITVRPGATPGARNVYVYSDGERAAFTGCIEVAGP